MTRRKQPIRVRVLDGNTTEFAGPGVLDAINTLGVPHMRSRHGKAWQVPGRHTDDLMALLEHRGCWLEVTL
jgi:hypothetical protein